MQPLTKCCAIVDAYSSARFYPIYFQQHGYNCVHVQTYRNLPTDFKKSLDEKLYLDNLKFDGNIDVLIEKLRAYQIDFVLPGVEPGVILSDKLSHALNLKSNVFALSEARRNKYLMGETLRKNGLNHIKQICSNDLTQIVDWVKLNTTWPVIIKPVDSAGSEGVHLCYAENQLAQYFHSLLNQINLMGCCNEKLLVQEYVRGDEYIVDSVSYKGSHYVTDIWAGRKKQLDSGCIIYDFEELLPYFGKVQDEMVGYMTQVRDVLGIKYGASHAELKYTDRGPVLIEVGARLHGLLLPDVHQECLGHDQAEFSCLSYANPEVLQEKIKSPYAIKKHAITLTLSSSKAGKIKKVNQHIFDKLKSLKGFFLKKNVGDFLTNTIDLITAPGYVYLVHEDRNIIVQDYDEIQKNMNHLFEVE